MPNEPQNPDSQTSSTEKEAPLSLRDIAENSYDEVIDDSQAEEPSGQDGPTRDKYGRFAPKDQDAETGEAERTAPSPERRVSETQTQQTEPAPEGRSTQKPPEHWSAEDQALYERQPPEVKAFLQRRASEMEADYTRKSQANAGAVNFASALTPVFTDPVISQSLQANGTNAVQAITQWADFHRRAVSQDPNERFGLLFDLSQRMGFDPAQVFAQAGNQSGQSGQLSEADMKDPAIRYFADNLGRIINSQRAFDAKLENIDRREVEKVQAETLKVTRWGIDNFAEEKDAQGNLRYPHFDRVLPHIINFYKVEPDLDLRVAYKRAVRLDDDLYEQELQAERAKLQNGAAVDRARAAVRGNTRGMTAPVSKPSAPTGNGSLRDLLEASAEEIGF